MLYVWKEGFSQHSSAQIYTPSLLSLEVAQCLRQAHAISLPARPKLCSELHCVTRALARVWREGKVRLFLAGLLEKQKRNVLGAPQVLGLPVSCFTSSLFLRILRTGASELCCGGSVCVSRQAGVAAVLARAWGSVRSLAAGGHPRSRPGPGAFRSEPWRKRGGVPAS